MFCPDVSSILAAGGFLLFKFDTGSVTNRYDPSRLVEGMSLSGGGCNNATL